MFIGGAVTITGALYAIYKIAKRLEDAIGTDSKGRTISERLDRVEHQLWENGGSSLADRVNTIEEHAIKTSTELEIIKNFLIPTQTSTIQPARKTRAKKAS
jgi:hypothetical protein